MIKKFKNGNINLSIKEDLKNDYYNHNNVENFNSDQEDTVLCVCVLASIPRWSLGVYRIKLNILV